MSVQYSYNTAVKRGAGCMIQSRRTGRFLMCKRGPSTPYPSVWSVPGGKAEGFETTQETALREAFEETGTRISGDVEHLYHFGTPTFSFDTFLVVIDDEFEPRLNDETEDAAWMTLEEIPSSVHDGLREILEDRATVKRLVRSVENTSGRPCEFLKIYRGR